MANPNTRSGQDIKPYSLEHILNQSFDQVNQMLMFEPVGQDGQNIQRPNADNLSLQIDYDGGTNPIYYGVAAPGTATSATFWLIKKLTFDGNNNVTAIQYAGGTPSFNAIWDNRASLPYS